MGKVLRHSNGQLPLAATPVSVYGPESIRTESSLPCLNVLVLRIVGAAVVLAPPGEVPKTIRPSCRTSVLLR